MSLTTNVTSNFSSNMATTSVKTEKVIVADVLAQKSTEIESSKIFLWIKKLSCKIFRLVKKRRSDPFLNEITIRNINTLSFKYTDSINQCFDGKEIFLCKNSTEVETFNSQISKSARKYFQLSFQITNFKSTDINITKKSENFFDLKYFRPSPCVMSHHS